MKNKLPILILALSICIVLGVEIVNLTKISLWHDESFSALLVKYDFGEMMTRIKMDVHPPLYYIFLRGWNYIFGNSLFSLRFFGVFFSVLAIISLYILVAKGLKNKKLALFSSVLFTFSCFQIQYAMEARMYPLGTFFVILGTFFFLKGLEEKKWKWWILYAVFTSVGLYTHYFVAFWIISQVIFFGYKIYKEAGFNFSGWIKNKTFRMGAASYSLAFISYIPWLPTFLKQMGQVEADYWIPAINFSSVPNTFLKMTEGNGTDPIRYWYVLVVLVATIALAAYFFLKKYQGKEKWLVFISFIFPFLATVILSVKRPIYIDRYFIFGLPFYLILMSGAILLINNIKIRRAAILLAVLGTMMTFPFHWSSLKVKDKPGMAAAAVYLNEQFKPGEKIFVGSSLIYFTLRYYNHTGYPAKLYAPDSMPHYSGTALLSPKDIIKDFNQETKSGDIVWLINTTGWGNWQPQVPANWQKQKSVSFQDVYNYQGWVLIDQYLVN
jgi:mannosyltransferase